MPRCPCLYPKQLILEELLEAGKMTVIVSCVRQKGISHQVTGTKRVTNIYPALYERPVLFSEEYTGKLVRPSHCLQELMLPNDTLHTQPT